MFCKGFYPPCPVCGDRYWCQGHDQQAKPKKRKKRPIKSQVKT